MDTFYIWPTAGTLNAGLAKVPSIIGVVHEIQVFEDLSAPVTQFVFGGGIARLDARLNHPATARPLNGLV